MARDRDFPRLRRMYILPMTSFLVFQAPAILFDGFLQIAKLQMLVSALDRRFRDRHIRVDSLDGGDSGTEFYRVAVRR